MADVSGLAASKVEGAAAHDAVAIGNPVLQGVEARTSLPVAVADGDAARVMGDDMGRVVTYPFVPRDRTLHNRLALTSTTETTLIAALASTFRDLVLLILSNESATEVRVDIRDSTAGTIRLSVDLAADGGGAIIKFPVPFTQATVNNNWTAQLSAAVSTVYVTAQALDAV